MTAARIIEGSYVEYPHRLEWGIGKVARVRGEKADVFFRDVREREAKTLKIAHLRLASILSDDLLDNLPPLQQHEGKLLLPLDRLTPKMAREAFLNRYPGGFNDTEYLRNGEGGERGYKWSAHERYLEAFGDSDGNRLMNQFGVDELNGKLNYTIGSVGNLLAVQETVAFKNGLKDVTAARRYFETLFALVREGPEERRFDDHASAVASLPESGATTTDKWTIVTLMPYLARPETFIFVKPSITKAAAEQLAFNIQYKPSPNWPTYAAILRMARVYMHELSDLDPRDYIDLQSFFWVTGKTYEKTRAARQAKRERKQAR